MFKSLLNIHTLRVDPGAEDVEPVFLIPVSLPCLERGRLYNKKRVDLLTLPHGRSWCWVAWNIRVVWQTHAPGAEDAEPVNLIPVGLPCLERKAPLQKREKNQSLKHRYLWFYNRYLPSKQLLSCLLILGQKATFLQYADIIISAIVFFKEKCFTVKGFFRK